MADILSSLMKQTNSEEMQIAVAEIENNPAEKEKKFKEILSDLSKLSEVEGIGEIATLLTLPEEHFEILSEVFLEELEKNYQDNNSKMEMVQIMSLSGIKSENIRAEYVKVCASIDEQTGDFLSFRKRDFLKRLLGMTYNTLAEAEGVAKRNILIPIEYCHTEAKMPIYAHLTDSGMDVFALEDITVAPGETKLVPTGIKVAIPAGYELQVRPKSGRCLKTKLRVANAPGTIDAGYRDEICVIIDNIEPFIKSADIDENGRLYNVEFGSSYTIGKGEKFAQLVLCEVPKAVFYEIEKVNDVANDGRNGGFGSTGVK